MAGVVFALRDQGETFGWDCVLKSDKQSVVGVKPIAVVGREANVP